LNILFNKIIKKKISQKTCKSSVARTHLGKEYTVFVWRLMPKEESKNVANAIYGMFKVMTGQVMRTSDNQIQKKSNKIRHDRKISMISYFKNRPI
jgi:hypothetical protein